MHQAADDIVNLLTEPPSSTVPSLKAGDPTRNAILELAQLLKRVQKIPEHIQETNPSTIQSPLRVQMKEKETSTNSSISPRVQIKEKETSTTSSISPRVHDIPYDEDEVDTPSTKRTPNTPIISAKTLQQHSNLPRNLRFKNQVDHKYRLRSKVHTIPPDSAEAERMFNPHHAVNHIYRPNGKKETIDSLLTGKSSDIWNRSLSND